MSIFCASQAAITTMDSDIHHPSSSSSSSSSSKGGRAIDRHNPIIQDQKRLTATATTTINPTPPPPPLPPNNKKKSKNTKTNNDQKRKTAAFADENNEEQLVTNNNNNQVVRRQGGVLLGWGCTRPGDFISPANSSRFLLSDKALSDQFDPLLKQVPLSAPPPPPPPPLPEKIQKSDDEKLFKKGDANLPSSPVKTPPRTSSSLSSRSSDQQVVVLKVSLHCRGCERKMRKHISKMEGVTSFNIDFMAKKVTVVGDVTPLGVLTSVSKVKNAKLLTPTTISTPTPPVDSDFSEIKKQLGFVA
ncbi:putative heavy metal-associated domain, HMA, heavy metal-associated domain superfamily [Helianthus anomalus]